MTTKEKKRKWKNLKDRKDIQRIINDHTKKSKYMVDVLKAISSKLTKETPLEDLKLRRERFNLKKVQTTRKFDEIKKRGITRQYFRLVLQVSSY